MTSPNTAIVVGASSGIGAAIARRLASDGRKVALLARREAELQKVETEISAAGGTARAYVHDVLERDAVDALWQRIEDDLGTVTELYYASGVMPEVGREEFDTGKDQLQARSQRARLHRVVQRGGAPLQQCRPR